MENTSLLTYDTKKVEIFAGGEKLSIECIRDLNKTIDDLFAVLEKQGNPALLEELCPYFGVIWPSARGLVEFMSTLFPIRFEDLRVLEVGCGLALPSLYLAKKGAHVTATDFHPEVPVFLQKNIELNRVKNLHFKNVNWTEKSQLPRQELYNWVIGSDILYESQHPEPVAHALASFVRPGGKILLADPARPYLQRFSDTMKELGFTEKSTVIRVPDDIGMKDIFILSFTKK